MWELPIYCQQCVDGGKTHKHKNHFPADEAGVAAYLRDRMNPGNEEMFADMSYVRMRRRTCIMLRFLVSKPTSNNTLA